MTLLNLFILMEEKIVYEHFLFGDEKELFISELEFSVDRIVIIPQIRPHKLEKAVSLCIEICRIADARKILLEKSKECPVLLYQLFKRGVFAFEEI